MCVVSMVIDQFSPFFQPTQIVPFTVDEPSDSGAALRRLIDEFRVALAAAKTVDRLTGQPDCEDPEKAKLLARVDALEKTTRRWVVKSGNRYLFYWEGKPWFTDRQKRAERFDTREKASVAIQDMGIGRSVKLK